MLKVLVILQVNDFFLPFRQKGQQLSQLLGFFFRNLFFNNNALNRKLLEEIIFAC